LNELITEKKQKIKNQIYEIDLEGDVLFSGTFEQCEDFIKRSRKNLPVGNYYTSNIK